MKKICYNLVAGVKTGKVQICFNHEEIIETLNSMKKNRNPFKNNNFLPSVIVSAGFIFAISMIFWAVNEKDDTKILSFSEIVSKANAGSLESITIKKDNLVEGKLKEGQNFISRVMLTEGVVNKFLKSGSIVNVDDLQGNNGWLFNTLGILVILVLLGLAYFVYQFFRNFSSYSQGGSNKLFNVTKSQARFFPADSVKTKFADVAGLYEAKEDLKEIVSFLRNPEKFKTIGAKIPRGILMSGHPGNGKTLLAKAVAGEAGTPFLSISGSDFVEVFVGVGASRVRDLFNQAKKHAPCIVFIDEIDTIGKKRGFNLNGGSDEREQTLNQLLSEMDGFATDPGSVIVLAATNREDVLDAALKRPGRFDRTIEIPFPDVTSREKILKLHASNVKVDPTVDFQIIAKSTARSSGADLANLVNEAALLAVKDSRTEVNKADFDQALDKLYMGSERKSLIRTPEELRETAVHESGHALLNMLQEHTDPLHKITIIARRHSLGVTVSLPEKDVFAWNKEWLMSRITVCLGGLLAEKLVLKTQSTGVSNDLTQATNLARNMVVDYGMSNLAPLDFDAHKDEFGRALYSEDTAKKIDAEVAAIINQAYKTGEELLLANLDKIEILTNALLEKETLDASEAYKLLGLEEPKIVKLNEINRKRPEMVEDFEIVQGKIEKDVEKTSTEVKDKDAEKDEDDLEDSNK